MKSCGERVEGKEKPVKEDRNRTPVFRRPGDSEEQRKEGKAAGEIRARGAWNPGEGRVSRKRTPRKCSG